MKKLFQKVFSLFKNNNLQAQKRGRKTKGQSMVEIAIALPVLLLLFSGMVEFGFMLNSYLSLLDATRASARFYSNLDPFGPDPNDSSVSGPNWFFEDASDMVRVFMDPKLTNPGYQGRRFELDPALDDIIITIYSVDNDHNTIVTTGPYRVYSHAASAFTEASIQSKMIAGSPNAGVLLVELIYSYEQVLKLPWMAFMGDPIMLRTHTIMPLNAVEP